MCYNRHFSVQTEDNELKLLFGNHIINEIIKRVWINTE
jgi:hypothetical protein